MRLPAAAAGQEGDDRRRHAAASQARRDKGDGGAALRMLHSACRWQRQHVGRRVGLLHLRHSWRRRRSRALLPGGRSGGKRRLQPAAVRHSRIQLPPQPANLDGLLLHESLHLCMRRIELPLQGRGRGGSGGAWFRRGGGAAACVQRRHADRKPGSPRNATSSPENARQAWGLACGGGGLRALAPASPLCAVQHLRAPRDWGAAMAALQPPMGRSKAGALLLD